MAIKLGNPGGMSDTRWVGGRLMAGHDNS